MSSEKQPPLITEEAISKTTKKKPKGKSTKPKGKSTKPTGKTKKPTVKSKKTKVQKKTDTDQLMKSNKPKLLHEISCKPLISHVIDTCYKMMHEADPTQYPRIF